VVRTGIVSKYLIDVVSILVSKYLSEMPYKSIENRSGYGLMIFS
jgi:hypothetical protein